MLLLLLLLLVMVVVLVVEVLELVDTRLPPLHVPAAGGQQAVDGESPRAGRRRPGGHVLQDGPGPAAPGQAAGQQVGLVVHLGLGGG